jgi:hypothetical protein
MIGPAQVAGIKEANTKRQRQIFICRSSGL